MKFWNLETMESVNNQADSLLYLLIFMLYTFKTQKRKLLGRGGTMYIKLTLLTCGMNLRNKEFNEHKFKSGNYNQSNLDYRGLKSLNS